MHEANEHYRRTMSFDHPLWMSVVPTSQIRLRLQIASYKSVEWKRRRRQQQQQQKKVTLL